MNEFDEYTLYSERRNALKAQASGMSLEALALEISRRCADILNTHASDLEAMLSIAGEFERDGKPKLAENIRRDVSRVRGGLEQLCRRDGMRYEPLEAGQALALLLEPADTSYEFRAGTVGNKWDTYRSELGILLNRSQPLYGDQHPQYDLHYDAIIGPISDLHLFGDQFQTLYQSDTPVTSLEDAAGGLRKAAPVKAVAEPAS